MKKDDGLNEEEQTQDDQRRTFLKKAAYKAPGLIFLGLLTKPKNVSAGFGPPPSDPSFAQWF